MREPGQYREIPPLIEARKVALRGNFGSEQTALSPPARLGRRDRRSRRRAHLAGGAPRRRPSAARVRPARGWRPSRAPSDA